MNLEVKIKKIKRNQTPKYRNKMYANMKPDTVKVPSHFPCAARVKMPQLGSEDSEIKIRRHAPRSALMMYQSTDLSKMPIQDSYLKQISTGIVFEEEVVKDRCFHTLPYDSKYFWEVLSLDGLVPLPPKSRIPVGRHNARGPDVRHMPCGFTKITKGHHLKPMKRKIMEKAMQMHQQALMAGRMEETRSEGDGMEKLDDEDVSPERAVFMTEVSDKKPKAKPTLKEPSQTAPKKVMSVTIKDAVPKSAPSVSISPSKVTLSSTEGQVASKNDWDSYLLSILSPLTANWVVHERMSPSDDQENLSKVLAGWYGQPDHTDLVRDDVSVTDMDVTPNKDKKTKKVKKEKELTFFEKIKAEVPKRAVDPYSDDNQAPFYRQPAGLRRQRKTEQKEEAGAINSTAHGIEVKSYQPSPPPTLRDFINPAVGDKMFETDNMYQQEWLTGAQQVYCQSDQDKIVMENDNKYKKRLQKEYPHSTECWFTESESEVKVTQDPDKGKINKGLRRWKELPEPVDDTVEVLNIVPPGYDPEFHRSPDPTTRRITKLNASLMQIIEEWRSKWHLSGQFADSSPMDLIRDMADIQPHVRLKAVSTVAKAAEYKPPEEAGIQLEYQDKQATTATHLPDEIFVALNYLLEDEHDRVQKAAAITLYSLNHPSDKAECILRDTLQGENGVDRWAAAQCLAHFGVCDSDVVGEIIKQLLDTEDSIKHEQAIMLLSKISYNSTLVHSLVAEQLNSTSWRHKVIACKILPTLHGTINRDITNKLSELMWSDWHNDVRKAAAHCLGKTQHGRDVHDDLKDRIASSNERVRLEAVSRIGQLGIMTAKLLPVFLECFDDPYVSIRVETCITSGNLEIKDDRVLEKLVYLATYDPIWKVKALAIQALGCIGRINDDIKECLMWALRYEEQEGVRAEACHSLVILGQKDEVFVEVLQDRLLVETSQIVREEIVEALRRMGVSTTEDMDMVTQIKGEVRKLCNRDVIASHIMVNEMDEDRRENLKRMIYETDKELERYFHHRNRFLHLVSRSDFDTRLQLLRSSVTIEKLHQEHQAMKEKAMKHIQSLSRMSSGGTQPHTNTGSRTSSAAVSREGTMFTPSADKELEALMSPEDTKEDLSESVTTKSRVDTVTATSISRPGTSGTQTDSQLSEGGGESYQSTLVKSRTEDSDGDYLSGETPGSAQVDGLLNRSDHVESAHSGSIGLNLAMTSPKGLAASSLDIRASRLSFIGTSTERKAQLSSRDTNNERQKVSAEALSTYKGLENRYSNFNADLMAIDRGLNTAGGNEKESEFPLNQQHEKVVASVVISSPDSESAMIEVCAEEQEVKDGSVTPVKNQEPESGDAAVVILVSRASEENLYPGTKDEAAGSSDLVSDPTDSVQAEVTAPDEADIVARGMRTGESSEQSAAQTGPEQDTTGGDPKHVEGSLADGSPTESSQVAGHPEASSPPEGSPAQASVEIVVTSSSPHDQTQQ
ncbi:LOW QUALITY PROTEIN: HEAT repeat-containing protein 4-like [Haliotis rubra]|uniref:LOW QUALITY PROTEIN: HEAT repeat-containing protein 4-like n=1 Tax=Haliotis rubra TaxID=36100 RepID=UPI001EE54A5F|nr:LOW QUALITY PROTEIN: HEAT repeat-containing protein 4-like [Haliotis rubra]